MQLKHSVSYKCSICRRKVIEGEGVLQRKETKRLRSTWLSTTEIQTAARHEESVSRISVDEGNMSLQKCVRGDVRCLLASNAGDTLQPLDSLSVSHSGFSAEHLSTVAVSSEGGCWEVVKGGPSVSAGCVSLSGIPWLPSVPRGPLVLNFETGNAVPTWDHEASRTRIVFDEARAVPTVVLGSLDHHSMEPSTRKRNLQTNAHGRCPRKKRVVVSAQTLVCQNLSFSIIDSMDYQHSAATGHALVYSACTTLPSMVRDTISTVTTTSRGDDSQGPCRARQRGRRPRTAFNTVCGTTSRMLPSMPADESTSLNGSSREASRLPLTHTLATSSGVPFSHERRATPSIVREEVFPDIRGRVSGTGSCSNECLSRVSEMGRVPGRESVGVSNVSLNNIPTPARRSRSRSNAFASNGIPNVSEPGHRMSNDGTDQRTCGARMGMEPTSGASRPQCAGVPRSTVTETQNRQRLGPPTEYRRFGPCCCVCRYCHARFWYEERLTTSTRRTGPLYSHCCRGGTVRLNTPRMYSPYIQELFSDAHFMNNIRAYNQMFSMTSLGATTTTTDAIEAFVLDNRCN